MISRESIEIHSSPDAKRPSDERFRLLVSCHRGSETALHVYDRQDRRVLMKWRGEIARRLLSTAGLPERIRTSGSHPCGKTLLKCLSLAAARIELELARGQALSDRLAALREDIPPPHRRVAETLFGYPGKHLSEQQIISLLHLQYPCIDARCVASLLDDLVAWEIIQRVEVGANRRFYDIDTRPHLHVYCAETDELSDAPGSGVIHATP